MTYTRTQPASRAPRGAYVDPLNNVFTGHFAGTLTTSTGTGDFPVVLGVPWTLTGISLSMQTTADQDVIASAYKGGVAVYANPNRPTITSGQLQSGLAGTFASTATQDFSSEQAFSMKLDQVGTSTATGTYLAAVVHYRARTVVQIDPLDPSTISGVATVAGILGDHYLVGASTGGATAGGTVSAT